MSSARPRWPRPKTGLFRGSGFFCESANMQVAPLSPKRRARNAGTSEPDIFSQSYGSVRKAGGHPDASYEHRQVFRARASLLFRRRVKRIQSVAAHQLLEELIHYLSVIEKVQSKHAAGDRKRYSALLFLAPKPPNEFLYPSSVLIIESRHGLRW